MRTRRSTFIQRTPIFLGCEGESEQAYGQLLNELLRAASVPVHLEVVNLNPGAGDPTARLLRASQEIARRQRSRLEFKRRAVLMDLDQVAESPERRREAEQLAQQLEIRVIWQEPCHEALLLRHLPRCSQHRPPVAAVAKTVIQTKWPEYRKPMTRMLLERRIGREQVLQAASVEPSLAAFLREIRLIP